MRSTLQLLAPLQLIIFIERTRSYSAKRLTRLTWLLRLAASRLAFLPDVANWVSLHEKGVVYVVIGSLGGLYERRTHATGTMSSGSQASQTQRTIIPLSSDAAARIKSSASITSLNQVVVGLVENSLDALAKQIQVRVDYGRGTCSVEDDGHGIPPAEFVDDGGLGQIYHTSKLHAPYAVHGRSGTFLASLAALSTLNISSHHESFRHSSSIAFYQSRVISRGTCRTPDLTLPLFKHGTVVNVQNLFGGMPVRVKQRALLSDDKRHRDRLLDELKHSLVALLLAWDRHISISIRHSPDNRVYLLRYATSLRQECRFWANSNARCTYPTAVASMLTKAGLAPLDTYSLWIPASAMSSSVHIRGVICLRPAPTKQVQFLSIGIHPVRVSERCSELLEHINGVFNLSDFGTTEGNVGLDEVEVERRRKDKRFKSDGQILKELRTGTKGIDRWPMFHLNIRLREDADAIAYEKLEAGTSTAFQSAVEVLDALIRSWLTTNNFSIKGQRHKRSHFKEIDQLDVRWRISTPVQTPLTKWKDHPQQQEDSLVSTGTYKRTPSIDARIFGIASPPNTPFHDFSRIKYGAKPAIDGTEPNLEAKPMFTMTPLRPGELNRVTQQPPNGIAAPVVDMTGGDASEEFCSINDNDASATPEDDTFEWEDPISKEKYRVNSRTGQAVLSIQQSPRSATAPLLISSRHSQFHKPITLSRTRPTPTSTSRLDSFLQGWQNPIFKTAEHGIRQVGFDLLTTDDVWGNFNPPKQIGKAFSEMPSSHASKLSKSALKQAVVISQVDKKFILLVMPGDSDALPDRVLTLVDQHATDERIQVEKLFSELLMPNDTHSPLISALGLQSRIKYTLLIPPLVFEISKLEIDLFSKHAAHFADWGILYDLLAQDSGSKGKLVIRTLPSLIAERCRQEPTTVISLLRAEVWTLADSATPTTAHLPLGEGAAPGNEQNWVKRIGGCPQGIIDMINSRACRSAIMFNDELSREECEELVKKVSECVFPFQCAHGRPSMVPLVSLGTVHGLAALEDTALPEHDRRSFGQAYRDWRLE